MNQRLHKSRIALLCLCAWMAISTNLMAGISPAWNIKFNSPVLWQKVTNLGTLVAGTESTLYGIDTEQGSILWELPITGNVTEDNFQELPNSFFYEIVNDKDVIILDPTTGKIICNTQAAGYTKVISKNILFKSGSILIYGFKGSDQQSMSAFDVATGKELWSKDDIFADKKMALTGAFMAMAASMQSKPFSFQLLEASDKEVIIAGVSGLYKINSQTGDVMWKSDFPRPKGAISPAEDTKMFLSPVEPMFYYAKANYIMAYHIADGTAAWPAVVKINGIVDEIIYLREGIVLCPKIDSLNTALKPKMNLVDYKTGKGKWGKKGSGIPLDGAVKSYQFTDAGIVLGMEKGTNSYLNILDWKTGTLKFQKSLKIKGFLEYAELTSKGLLYITGSTPRSDGELNIFDLNTGAALFSKPIEPHKPSGSEVYIPGRFSLLHVSKDNKMYVYTNKDKVLYEVDKSTGTFKAMTGKIELQGNEKISGLELRNEGIMLSSEQNILLVDFSGKIKYQKYYAAPTEPGLKKALLFAAALASGYDAARYGMASEAFKSASVQSEDVMAAAMFDAAGKGCKAAADANAAYSKMAMQAAKARFKASSQAKNHMFMMISLEKDMLKSKCGLAKINKDTGEREEVINLGNDKKPGYDVDNISNKIYYRVNSKEIACYKF